MREISTKLAKGIEITENPLNFDGSSPCCQSSIHARLLGGAGERWVVHQGTSMISTTRSPSPPKDLHALEPVSVIVTLLCGA